jgi:hypothetical protein
VRAASYGRPPGSACQRRASAKCGSGSLSVSARQRAATARAHGWPLPAAHSPNAAAASAAQAGSPPRTAASVMFGWYQNAVSERHCSPARNGRKQARAASNRPRPSSMTAGSAAS